MTGGQLELKWAAARTAKVSEIESVEAAVSGPKYPDVAKITLTIEETGQKVLADVRYNGTEFAYDYKFNYHTLPQVNAYANAWLEADGRYRMDYLPVGGRYVLVETRTPEGYVKAEPVAVKVEETVDVQLHDVFNERKHLALSKVSSETGKELPGAKLALYRADLKGECVQEAEYLLEQWGSGTDGVYTETDRINGRIPAGYEIGDLKPHVIYGLEDGVYYLVEEESPAYYQVMKPVRIDYRGGETAQVIQGNNQPVKGKLLVKKTDEDGKLLRGAVFELCAYERSGKRVEGFPITVSDTNGMVSVEALPAGTVKADGSVEAYTYKLKEVTPPDGFAANPRIFTFTFDGDGDYRENPETEYALYETSVENSPTRIRIEKKDFDQLNDAGTDGAFVEGALLAVYEARMGEDGTYTYEEENLFEQWSSNGGPHLLEGLTAGKTYILVEQAAPKGYTLMKPVLFNVSKSGRSIWGISNEMTMVKVDYVKGDDLNIQEDTIGAVTIRGRIVLKNEVVMLDETGKEVLRFAATGKEQLIPKIDELEENGLYTFEEHTVYSDGSDVVTKRRTRRVRFGEKGFVYEGRTAERTELTVSGSEGNVITTMIPLEAGQEQTISNGLNPENPKIVVKNRNGQAGEPLMAGQPVINTVTYYNPSSRPQTITVEAAMDENTELLDAYEGEAEGKTIRWIIPDAEPYTSGSVSFASSLAADCGGDVRLNAVVKVGNREFSESKIVPILKPNHLTVFNELTGSGQKLHQTETGRFIIRLWDERGRELAGSYRYEGSRSGLLRSGDAIELAGNEYITIDPANYKNCSYEVVREEDGREVESYETKGQIGTDGTGSWFTRSVQDQSDRQLFVKGETYFLTEITRYSDGEERVSSRMSFTLDEQAGISAIGGYDKETEVVISKTDLTTGEELPGNHLTVTDEKGEIVDQWISREEPHVIRGLEPGKKYTLTEVRPAEGFAWAEKITFQVNEDGTAEEILMENRPTHAVITKKDITNGEELPGAHLELLDEDGNTVDEWISTDRPHEIVGELTAGASYVLRETIPAEGFVKASDISFRVNPDGSINDVEMKDDTTKVRIYKNVWEEAGPSAGPGEATPPKAERGTPIAGAVLQILNEDKTPALWNGEEMIFTTTDSFAYFEKQLTAGQTYWLREVRPAPGFAWAEDVKFTVSQDGSVDVVLMEDKPTVVRITKTDITGEQEVPGCKLQLVDEKNQLIEEWISTDRPHEIVGKLEAGKEYRLIETNPAPGYAYARDVVFTVNRDGSVNQVEMRDDVTKVEILKVSAETGRPLAGAKFEIRTWEGELVERWSSTKEAYRIEGKLLAGETYLLREVSAPSGYKPMADVHFKVNDYGEPLRITAENRKKEGGGGGRDYTIRLKKVDEEGNPLPGAAFKVEDESGRSLSLLRQSEGTVFQATVKTPGILTVTELSGPEGYEKLEGEYRIQIPEKGDAVLLNGDEAFYQEEGNSYVFYAVNRREPEQPEIPRGRTVGWITAEYDRRLFGNGKALAQLRGQGIELVKTGDDFPYQWVTGILAVSAAGFGAGLYRRWRRKRRR